MRMARGCLVIFSLLSGCSSAESGVYPVDQVQIEKVTKGTDNVILHYRTPAETLYHSPGVKVSNSNGKRRLEVVRCHIEENCPTDIQAEQRKLVTIVRIPKGDKPLVLYAEGQEKPIN